MHIMLDLETLGVAPGCTILSIGAVRFDADGVQDDVFDRVISRASCQRMGLTEDPGTLDWWDRQTAEARVTLNAANVFGATPIGEALADFRVWYFKADRSPVWGNGADFDLPILAAAYRACGYNGPPWLPYDGRCYRTVKNMSHSKIERRFGSTHHNAVDDARNQAEHLIKIWKELSV